MSLNMCCPAHCVVHAFPLPCPPFPSVNNMREGVGYIFSSFMEAAGYTVGRARAYTGAAANLATQVCHGGLILAYVCIITLLQG